MTDRDYAIKSMKEITFQMASHAQDYLEVTIERHYTDIKRTDEKLPETDFRKPGCIGRTGYGVPGENQ